jgi:hypothetical protein
MTPHPLATWVQISVSPRRHAVRRRRRRTAALLLRSTERAESTGGTGNTGDTGSTAGTGTTARPFTIPSPRLPVPPSVRRV